MLRGIYSSAAGMIMSMDKVAMHAGNISNSQTAGYKRREMSSVPFKELMINVMTDRSDKPLKVAVGTGSGSGFMNVDASQGSLKPTGNNLDIGIAGNGHFVIQRAATGEQFATRNGRFILDDKGYMVTADGDYLVDDKNKAIKLDVNPNDKKSTLLNARLTIKETGEIFDEGKRVAQLKLKTDTNTMEYIPQLQLAVAVQADARKNNVGAYVDKENKVIRIKQGFLEGANIQIISEMVGLIHASKNYESGHKLIMNEDKILDKAINELGRTG